MSDAIEQIPREDTRVDPTEVPASADDLNDEVELFCLEYANNGRVGVDAALAVWPDLRHGSAKVKATRLLKREDVRGRVKDILKARARKLAITGERLLERHAEQAFFDPNSLLDEEGRVVPFRQMDPAARRQIRGIKVKQLYATVGDQKVAVGNVVELKLADPAEARRDLLKHLGLDGSKDTNINVGLTVVEVTPKLDRDAWRAKYSVTARIAPPDPKPAEAP